MSEKLHKILAARGLGSRREMERWIAAGRVCVNGQPARIGDRADAEDEIAVDGRPLDAARSKHPPSARVLVHNKRAGVIVSRRDPQGRETIFEGLPRLANGRWISVGRLDLQTSGLLLMTSDGALAHALSHPSSGIDREYAVRVRGKLADASVDALRAGIELDGRVEAFSDIRYYDGRGSNHWYHVVLMEGRNREVRRLFASQGAEVTRLKRVRYGPVVLPPWLPRGTWTEMGADDVDRLRTLVGLAGAAPHRSHRSRGRSSVDRRSGSAGKRTPLLIPYPTRRPPG